MATLTFPLSRIEGHAQVVIEVEAGEVVSAHFQATEYRGFQHFVQGVPAEQMPVIVPRICGVCSTAHHIAAVGALEDVYNVTPPPVALKLRELLLLGQLIQNQATSLFLFTMPDCLGLNSIFDHSEDPQLERFRTQFGSRSLMVRKAGTDLINAVGGQSIHPVKAVVGGMTTGVPQGEAEAINRQMKKTLPIACELFDSYWTRLLEMGDRIGTWGDDEPAYYISSGGNDRPDFASGVVQFMNPDGTDGGAFSAPEFLGRLTHRETDYSYAGKTSYQGQVIRANSLARINMFERMETPLAEKYLERFRSDFGRPAHELLLYDLARGIELVYAIEQAIRILEEPLVAAETAVSHTERDGEGYGLVEAPRGPLIHHYRVRKGLIEKAEFIIPTVHNVMAIERALKVAAQRYISPQKVDMELEHAVGRVVRAFDPCIACATH
jgi:coenzyme F420-reducing hydrogenase alpha subunit